MSKSFTKVDVDSCDFIKDMRKKEKFELFTKKCNSTTIWKTIFKKNYNNNNNNK